MTPTLLDQIRNLILGSCDSVRIGYADLYRSGTGADIVELQRQMEAMNDTLEYFGISEYLRMQYIERAQEAGTFTAGGALLQDRVGANIVNLLRPSSSVIRAGAVLEIIDPAGTSFPAITTGATAQWLGETQEANVSTAGLSQFKPSPHRCTSAVRISRQLLVQSPTTAESAFRRDLFASIGSAVDVASISGIGGAEPLGALFNKNIPAPVTFAGAATLDDFLVFEETLADSFTERESGMAFITSPAARRKLRKIEGITGSGNPIWSDENRIIGQPAFASPAVATDQAIFGFWGDWRVFLFGGIELIVDRFTEAKGDQIEVVSNVWADCGPLRPKSFAFSTDSAAQV